jgi:hypothetical protein
MVEKTGRSSLGSALHDLNFLIFEKNKNMTGIIGAFVILGLTIGVFWWEADSKADVTLDESSIRSIIRSIEVGTGTSTIPEIAGFIETKETMSEAGYLAEGAIKDIPINASDVRVIRSINVTLSWTDEPDIRRIRNYENQPDEFTLKVIDPQGKVLKESTISNTHEEAASLFVPMTLDDNALINYMGQGDFSVEVTLNVAGDYRPRPGIRTIADDGNDFSLDLITIYYDGSSI